MSRAAVLAMALLASCVGACAAHAGEPGPSQTFAVDVAAGPLLGCLEQLSQRASVRIVDASGRVAAARCAATRGQLALEAALKRWLDPLSLSWHRRDDGTIEIVQAARPRMDLDALTIEDSASPDVARVLDPGAVLAPTVLAENATAVTRIEGDWLQRAPWLGFSQISRYAPNMYGTGQGLAIRGIERGTDDHFTTLTVSLDGIDLGTRLLDDDMVLLNGLQRIDLVRGARSFEAGHATAAGEVRLISAAPTTDDEFGVGVGWGTAGIRRAEVRWSGSLPADGLGGTAMLAYRSVPNAVHFQNVPEANGKTRDTANARLRLDYAPDAVPGLQAGINALAVSADAVDRLVTPDSADWEYGEVPRGIFERISFAPWARLMSTRATGAAGFVRYAGDDDSLYELHGGDTLIRENVHYLLQEAWSESVRENRSRAGFSVRKRWRDTTLVTGFEHTGYSGRAASKFPDFLGVLEQQSNRLRIVTDSASFWMERQWSSAWETGLGLRWLREGFAEDVRDSMPWRKSSDQSMALPLAVLGWHPSDTQSVVLSRTAGYASGGSVSIGSADGVELYHHYPATPTKNAELAWHAAWTSNIRTDLTLFRSTTTERRDLVLGEGGREEVRLLTTDIKGAEVETTVALPPHWQLRAGLGLLHSHYHNGNDVPVWAHATGPVPGAPPFTALLGLRYGADAGWYAALDAYRAGATATYESSQSRRPDYTVVDGSMGYVGSGWQATLAATNLTNARYAERFSLPSYLMSGWRLGDPRRLELRMDFNW